MEQEIIEKINRIDGIIRALTIKRNNLIKTINRMRQTREDISYQEPAKIRPQIYIQRFKATKKKPERKVYYHT